MNKTIIKTVAVGVLTTIIAMYAINQVGPVNKLVFGTAQ